LAAVDGVTKAFAEPAFQALPPRLVGDDQLAAANGMLATASLSAIAFGPLLASASIALFGFEGAFVVDSITFLIGVAVLVPFHIGAASRRDPTSSDSSVAGEFREGIRVVATRPALRLLMLLAASCYLIWGAFIVVEPLYVREVLHGTPTTFALLQTTFGVALLATGIVVTRLGDRAVRWSVVCASTMASGLCAAIYVGTSVEAVAFVGIVAWGVVTACFIAPLRTLMQRAAPVEVHGRVFALDGSLHSLGDLISLPLIGLAVAAVGVQVAGAAIAIVPVVGGGLIWMRVRRDAIADGSFAELDPVSAVDPAASVVSA
jgi:predicted MFS family arabinose efflux permease